jgi:transposase
MRSFAAGQEGMVTLVSEGLVVGVDTHKDVHVAAVLDQLGRRLAVRGFPATDAGNMQLADWLAGLGPVTDAGIEGTGSYGYRLARLLAERGLQVREINCPDRSRRRRKGKSDPVDAENAARTVLAGEATAVPKDRRGFVGELRLLVLTRRSAVKARTQASNQIKAFLVDADDELRARLCPLRKRRFGRACAALEPDDGLRRALAALGRRWLALDSEARELEQQIAALITAHAPGLLARHGVGAVTAAQLLVTAGANPDRLHGDAALAALCGASPVQASSGKTSRHRLNRGGDRAAQQCAVGDRTCPHDLRPANPCLRRQAHRDWKQPPGNHAHAPALRRPRAISLDHRRPPPHCRYWLDIGASVRAG